MKNKDASAPYADKIKLLIPFNSLYPKFQGQAMRQANITNYNKNAYVFREGGKDHFSIYLLQGELQVEAGGQAKNVITADSDTSRYALAQLQPRRFSAKVKSDQATMLLINRHLLDKVIVLQEKEQQDAPSSEAQGSKVSVQSLQQDGDQEEQGEGDWMVKMLQSDLFSKIPTANIYKLFEVMEEYVVKPKQVIVRQGEKGDSYYVIREGRCAVVQKIAPGKPPAVRAKLQTGDSFGEESLVSKGMRNASVVMLTNGVLMRLTKKNFEELIRKPTLNGLSYKQACKKAEEESAVWLDVRFPSEIQSTPVNDAINIPIHLLRKKMDQLERDKVYIVCCDTGERSSTAAFLLTQRGFNSCYVEGGLQSIDKEE